jgi:hypothetical protein
MSQNKPPARNASQGQIDFYDDPQLIDPAAGAIVEHLTTTVT